MGLSAVRVSGNKYVLSFIRNQLPTGGPIVLFTIKDAVFNQGKTIGPIGGGNRRLIMHVTSNKTRGYSAVGTEHYANVRTTEGNTFECSVTPRMISESISNKEAMQ